MNVIDLVKNGKGYFEWSEICSEHKGYKLYIKVFRDAMKFDNIPSLTWNFVPAQSEKRVENGVRLPASAHQLQAIAYMLDCMLMTPLVIELIYLQAGVQFNANVNIKGNIVAVSDILDVHDCIEDSIKSKGGDDGTKLISCVGKYWTLMNQMKDKRYRGDFIACNYGWFSSVGTHLGITKKCRCWQSLGFRHNKRHWDPSQVIRLMDRKARLVHPNGKEEEVDLHDLMLDPVLSYLIHHEGVLHYQAQQGVDFIKPIPQLRPDWVEPKPEPEPEPEPEVIEPIISEEEEVEEEVIEITEEDIISSTPNKIMPTKNIWQALLAAWAFIVLWVNKVLKRNQPQKPLDLE